MTIITLLSVLIIALGLLSLLISGIQALVVVLPLSIITIATALLSLWLKALVLPPLTIMTTITPLSLLVIARLLSPLLIMAIKAEVLRPLYNGDNDIAAIAISVSAIAIIDNDSLTGVRDLVLRPLAITTIIMLLSLF